MNNGFGRKSPRGCGVRTLLKKGEGEGGGWSGGSFGRVQKSVNLGRWQKKGVGVLTIGRNLFFSLTPRYDELNDFGGSSMNRWVGGEGLGGALGKNIFVTNLRLWEAGSALKGEGDSLNAKPFEYWNVTRYGDLFLKQMHHWVVDARPTNVNESYDRIPGRKPRHSTASRYVAGGRGNAPRKTEGKAERELQLQKT